MNRSINSVAALQCPVFEMLHLLMCGNRVCRDGTTGLFDNQTLPADPRVVCPIRHVSCHGILWRGALALRFYVDGMGYLPLFQLLVYIPMAWIRHLKYLALVRPVDAACRLSEFSVLHMLLPLLPLLFCRWPL